MNFEDNTVDLIYASHIIEYFDRDGVKELLIEWQRVLKHDSILRLGVPDFFQIAKLYTEKKYPLDNFVGPLYGKMKMKDKLIYHKTVYDFTSLKELLQSVGFRKVRRYNWWDVLPSDYDDYSMAYIPYKDRNGIQMHLNIECIK